MGASASCLLRAEMDVLYGRVDGVKVLVGVVELHALQKMRCDSSVWEYGGGRVGRQVGGRVGGQAGGLAGG